MDNPVASAESRDIYRRADPGYKHGLNGLYNGDTLRFCYQCGICTAVCPLSQILGVYRPNKILGYANLGIRNVPQSTAFLLCSACSQCTKGCPQGVKVHEIMQALKDLTMRGENTQDYLLNNLEDALKALSEEIPFPVSYAWICLNLGEYGDNGNFNKQIKDVLIRVLSKTESNKNFNQLRKTSEKNKNARKIAVIGSGPSGLTAAWELYKAGFFVTVFEPLPEAGGMLTVGIPSYRLSNDIVAIEIDNMRKHGIEIKTNTPVNREMFDNFIKNKKFDAVFIASGAHIARNLRIKGEDLDGVMTALDFLRGFNLNEIRNVGKKVVVIGGGNVGIDAARTALRCGAETVELYCLEARNEMPSHLWEIHDAVTEGVVINASWGPVEIRGGDKVAEVGFVRCKSVFDENKRFNPVFDNEKSINVEADAVITAVGQSPGLGFLGSAVTTNRGVVTVDPLTMETNLPGVFAGGDTVFGTASLIEAIVAGRTAAGSIIRYIEGLDS